MLHLDTPAVGQYNVTAEYLGDGKYRTSKNNISFEVFETGGVLTVSSPSVFVNDTNNITVYVAGRHEGEINITISNAAGEIVNKSTAVINPDVVSNATFLIGLLDAGKYRVSAIFVEVNGTKTTIYEGTGSFEVYKLASDIKINKTNATIRVGEDEIIVLNITLDSRHDGGNISVFVNGVEYNTTTSKLTVAIPNLNAGNYSVLVVYHGNEWYNESSNTTAFEVIRNEAPIGIAVTNSTVGSVEQINVTLPNDAAGQVLLDIAGQHYYANITGGLAQFNITGLKSAEYKFNVTYLGNYKYLANNTNSTLTVSKLGSTVDVEVDNITVGDVAVVNITVTTGATGNVTVEIAGKYYNIVGVVDGTFSIDVANLAAGNYTVVVRYNGDDKYINSTDSAKFTVNRTSVGVIVVAENITYGDTEDITVYVDATGNVTITVSDAAGVFKEFKEQSLVDGSVSVSVTGLAAGNYTVEVTYNGNENLTKNVAKANFTVSKAAPVITVATENITYYSVENINIDVNAGGNVTVKVNGNEVAYEIALDNNHITVPVSGLKAGIYYVDVIYNGNANYTGGSSKATFVVNKAPVTVEAEVADIGIGGTEIINVTISNVNATGNVIINVDGVNYTRPISAGEASLTVPASALTNGTHYVVVIYEGDANLTGNWTSKTFHVDKLASDLTIDVTNTTVGSVQTIKVNVTAGATGKVVITVDGKDYYVPIGTDGFATLELNDLANRTYVVEARYLGDDKYNESTGTASFNVAKVPSKVTVEVDNIVYGDNAAVNITVTTGAASGNVTITIGDEYNKTVGVTGSRISVIVPGLTAGDKTVEVTYNGNYKYLPSSGSANFTVSSSDVDMMAVVAQNITYGQTETITVYVNAKGNVTFRINNQEYDTINITDGKAVLSVYLGAGNYTVEAIYNGQPGFSSKSVKANFTVEKADPIVTVEVENIIYGDIETIIIHANADGKVTVTVDGKSVEVSLANGEGILRATSLINSYQGNATVKVLDLAAGIYQAIVEYEGNENYNKATVIKEFTVYKGNVSMDIEVEPSVPAGETQVINITMSNINATGKVTIYIGGNNYTVDINNGHANFTTPVLHSGTQGFVIIYEGNENFNLSLVSGSFVVEEIPELIDVSVNLEVKPSVPAGETQVINITMSNSTATGKVIISISGEEYIRYLDNGVANFTTPVLPAGNHTIIVVYEGNDIFNSNWTSATFEVEKAKSSVSVEITKNPAGDDQTITVTVDKDDATGYVIVDVDGKTYAAELDKGTGSITISGLTAGNHTIKVKYLGDENYAPSSDETNLELSKLPTVVGVTVENITVGDKAVIEITVPENATGNATVNVDGTDYTVNVAGGKGTLVLSDLGVGEHKVTVTYNGDEIYDSSSDSAVFEVAKQDGNDVVKVTDQGDGTVVVEVPEGTTGTVTIEIDGEKYTGEIVDGKAVIDLENATPGVHEAKVTVPGNENRTETVIDTTASIPKEETLLDVSVDGDTIVVTVPEGASGDITVEVDGKTYTQPIKGTQAKFTIDDLSAGDKTAVVKYAGDDNYASNTTSVDLTVPEEDPDMKVTIKDGNVGEDVTVTVELPKDATGQVLIDIDGVGYYANVTSGVAKLEIPNVFGGKHDVKVTYTGDDKYAADSYSDSFNMKKVDSSITPSAEDITVGDKAVIEVSVPEDATGNVTVNVDGKDYTTYVANGKATVVLSDLGVGEHKVTVTYNGDGKYNPSKSSTTFEVAKQNCDDVVKVTDQGDGTVVVEVPEGTTGTVTVEVDGEKYTGEIVDGKAVIKLENATPGVHKAKVTVPGNENRTETVIDTTVSIPKEQTALDITVDDINVGDDEGIVVEVPKDATGNITIEIDGKAYTKPVNGGKAVFAIEGLTAGNKTATIRYSGDNKYASVIDTATFNVAKINSTIESTIDDSKVGENVVVNVVLPDDATGVVLIDIGGVGYYANVTNGVAHVEIPRIPSGYYDNVKITYLGDDKYSAATNTTSFNMSKVDSFVIPNAVDITYGENEVITLNVPKDATGNVTVTINGVEYRFSANGELLGSTSSPNSYTVAVSGGNGILTISGLPEGEYLVSATYNGDDKYFSVSNTTKFRVAKSKLTMDVIDQGNGTVLVVLPEDATGNVTVKLGNETYAADVENGKAWVTLDGATPGIHEIEVTYSGDKQYNSKTVQSSVVIPKYDTPISVDVDDIHVGDILNVEITLPEGATGDVTIEIDGEEYAVTIEDGKVTVPISGLTAGDKTMTVKYGGDDNYLSNATTARFTVSKVSSTVKASAKDTSFGNDAVINVEVPNDATGRVLVNINGVGYYANIINGKAKVFIPGLPIGSYTATVIYEGDDKYLPSEPVTVSFDITKANAPMSAYGSSIEVGDDATITVYLPEDATGTVTLKIDGKTYVAEVKNGKAVFIIPDLAPGDHKIVAIYSGDDKYAANITESDVVVYNNETPGNNTPDNNVPYNARAAVGLSRYETANPIWMLLLALVAISSIKMRRFKK